jgi:hypothetical protein
MNNCTNRLEQLKKVFKFIGSVVFLATEVVKLLSQIHR